VYITTESQADKYDSKIFVNVITLEILIYKINRERCASFKN